MQINPYFNFASRKDFPHDAISLIASDMEIVSRFIIWAHEYVETRLESEGRKIFPLADDKLFAECIGGVLREGKSKFHLTEDATCPLPEHLMRYVRCSREKR